MPTYKLYYIDARGRAELIRWIFIQAGVQFEDVRLTEGEWAAFKPKTPFRVLPLLEVDGKLYGGSGPIARYVAEEYGLAGSTPLENLELAGIYDVTEDVILKLVPIWEESDETRSAELNKELLEKHIPRYLGILEKLITENKSPGGWIYGNKLTYVDLRIAQICDVLSYYCEPDFLNSAFPAVVKVKDAVEALPKIAKWIQERPKTLY